MPGFRKACLRSLLPAGARKSPDGQPESSCNAADSRLAFRGRHRAQTGGRQLQQPGTASQLPAAQGGAPAAPLWAAPARAAAARGNDSLRPPELAAGCRRACACTWAQLGTCTPTQVRLNAICNRHSRQDRWPDPALRLVGCCRREQPPGRQLLGGASRPAALLGHHVRLPRAGAQRRPERAAAAQRGQDKDLGSAQASAALPLWTQHGQPVRHLRRAGTCRTSTDQRSQPQSPYSRSQGFRTQPFFIGCASRRSSSCCIPPGARVPTKPACRVAGGTASGKTTVCCRASAEASPGPSPQRPSCSS